MTMETPKKVSSDLAQEGEYSNLSPEAYKSSSRSSTFKLKVKRSH
jgi:hypothetical protein